MAAMRDLNQYLQCRSGHWHYVRRVPICYTKWDTRGIIRTALRTTSIEVARSRRDSLCEADEHFWASLEASLDDVDGELKLGSQSKMRARYKAACGRAMARGFVYTPANELAQTPELSDLIERIMQVGNKTKNKQQEAEALLGGADMPKVKLSAAFKIYCDRIAIGEVVNKSEAQKKAWKKSKLRAINNFIKIVGDIHMDSLDRTHARKFYNWWGTRLLPKDGRQGLNPNSANRDLGNLRKLYREYWEYEGQEERQNPFRKLRFKDKNITETPPFPDKWVQSKILRPNVFDGLNDEARLLVYGLIETGCRPSEVANLLPENICLNHEVPHIRIKPHMERELKSMASNRVIPLVGISLEAFKKAPEGFPHYRDKSALLSASLMKAFRVRGLMPSGEHKIYSFRHSFEKRMLEAGLDYGLRCLLMGHKNNRPSYGDGGSLEYRRNELLKIAHPISKALTQNL